MARRTRRILPALAVGVIGISLTAGTTAAAAAPKLVSPKRGQVFAVGADPTFKVKDTSRAARRYRVYLVISPSKKLKKDGQLKNYSPVGQFTSMKRKGTTFTYKSEDYTFPNWYMMRRGKYYWQAHHIDCTTRRRTCRVTSKLGSFFVR